MKDTARFFKVLADEARLKMLWLLFHHRELCVCDIMAALGITQSKASRHLAVLRNAGLVTDRKEGLWSYYSLRAAGEEPARACLRLLRTNLSRRPEAEQLLRKIEAWFNVKDNDATCLTQGSRCRAAKQFNAASASRYRSGGAE